MTGDGDWDCGLLNADCGACCLVASSGPDSQPDPLAWQYDLKTRRTFLKRCDYPSVGMAQLYKGSIITVYSRQLTIADYGDGA